jgi:hypothetical protein
MSIEPCGYTLGGFKIVDIEKDILPVVSTATILETVIE